MERCPFTEAQKVARRIFCGGRCELCRAAGPLEADHRNGRRDDNSSANLWMLCVPCHGRKTAEAASESHKRYGKLTAETAAIATALAATKRKPLIPRPVPKKSGPLFPSLLPSPALATLLELLATQRVPTSPARQGYSDIVRALGDLPPKNPYLDDDILRGFLDQNG
jgi:hypothetical protein